MMEQRSIKVGDKVRTGVYVIGEWRPIGCGVVVSQSDDGSVSVVDKMALFGGAPWCVQEATSNLRPFDA
jgi:hypothetical protein